jgi:hypothetical protein
VTLRPSYNARGKILILKEITESVDSVKKTLRGKFDVDETGRPRFQLGPEVLPPALAVRAPHRLPSRSTV